jgi:hypothetical protein
MPHSIDTLLVHMKDTLKEFGVSEDISVDIGGNLINQALDAIYYANPRTLGQSYACSLDFRQAALEQGFLYEQWLRSQLGMSSVRSFPEDDAIISGLVNHLGDLIIAISSMRDEFKSNGIDSKKWFAGVDASVAKASNFLQQCVEGDTPSENLPPTRFERDPVL